MAVDFPGHFAAFSALAGDHAFMDRLPPGNRQAVPLRLESAPSSELPRLLEGADADRLTDVGGWIAECASGDELLDRVGQAGGLAWRPPQISPRPPSASFV